MTEPTPSHPTSGTTTRLAVTKLAEQFWFWQAINPDTPPTGWPNGAGPLVGSVFLEVDDGIILIDPQVPPDDADRDRFWAALDRDMARHHGQWLAILLTFPGHDRSTRDIVARYDLHVTTSVWIPAGTVEWSAISHTHVFGRETALPGGVVPILFDYPGGYPEAEAAFVIPAHHALVLGDAVIGHEAGDPSGPGLRVPPDSTFIGDDEASREAVRAWFGTGLRDAMASVQARFAPSTVLVTHGEPMVGTGGTAISDLLNILEGFRAK
jgi:hypothetical protein